MINQYEVPAYLVDELPEMKEELRKASPTLNIFKSIQCLADYTKNKVVSHDLLMVKKCFSLAEELYSRGNTIVKNAIENVVVFAFSSLMYVCSEEERNKLQSMMPLCLHTAYIQQVLKSGI